MWVQGLECHPHVGLGFRVPHVTCVASASPISSGLSPSCLPPPWSGRVGPDAPEIMQGLAVALKAGATKAVFDSTIGEAMPARLCSSAPARLSARLSLSAPVGLPASPPAPPLHCGPSVGLPAPARDCQSICSHRLLLCPSLLQASTRQLPRSL